MHTGIIFTVNFISHLQVGPEPNGGAGPFPVQVQGLGEGQSTLESKGLTKDPTASLLFLSPPPTGTVPSLQETLRFGIRRRVPSRFLPYPGRTVSLQEVVQTQRR